MNFSISSTACGFSAFTLAFCCLLQVVIADSESKPTKKAGAFLPWISADLFLFIYSVAFLLSHVAVRLLRKCMISSHSDSSNCSSDSEDEQLDALHPCELAYLSGLSGRTDGSRSLAVDLVCSH
eukprot:TRINITY_DN110762_c0_g1_i1.p1 TRINITY_DN110762_c0_g1~~TRINITY_DN110762_c0_g1_i1.p1  ORF type:complete len:124 (+),score=11.58 TRINITY_DN110762_c0_g1_i1:2-373(+)